MRFGEDFLEELKSRLRPSDVIGRTVKLRRQGREYAGLSPFNKEKTPSFFVNDEKGFYHCFSSGKHGDVIDFLMEAEHLSFPEAVERLTREAGMALPEQDVQDREFQNKRAGLENCLQEAHAFFKLCLQQTRGDKARSYLEGRGFQEKDWQEFGLGLAPSGRKELKDVLQAKGITSHLPEEAGLVITPEDGGESYDRFRNRLIFPIHDSRGRLVGFGGRALDSRMPAKYLNSPETPLFHKGKTLYRYAEARKALFSSRSSPSSSVIVVEGYMDALALARAGFSQTVAPLGTALTEDQLALLWRLSAEPVLFFDGDAAGQRAAHRVLERALPHIQAGKSLRFVRSSDSRDPDDLVREEGPQAIRHALDHAQPLFEVLWSLAWEAEPLETPEQKAGLKKRLDHMLRSIQDKDTREHYRHTLMGRYYEAFRVQTRRRPAGSPPYGASVSQALKAQKTQSEPPIPVKHLLGAVLLYPDLMHGVEEDLAALELKWPLWDQFRHRLLEAWVRFESLDKDLLNTYMEEKGMKSVVAYLEGIRTFTHAEIGEEHTSLETRLKAWRHLMDKVLADQEGSDQQSRFEEEIERGDAQALHRMMQS